MGNEPWLRLPLFAIMKVFIKAQSTVCLDVSENDTVASLKQALAAAGHQVGEDNFAKDGHVIDNETTLCNAGVSDLSHLDVVGLLPGGKVNGQTPKVDAQEKKKKKTGRAARRQQYNRRFVNVVASFGRRRGPNSNS